MRDNSVVTTEMTLGKLSNASFILHFNLENDFKLMQGMDMFKFTISQESVFIS